MTGTYFDTVVQVEAWGADREILDRCEELCAYYENLLSPSIEESEIYKINQSHGLPVSVSDETAGLLRLGIHYGELSGGKLYCHQERLGFFGLGDLVHLDHRQQEQYERFAGIDGLCHLPQYRHRRVSLYDGQRHRHNLYRQFLYL